MKRSFVSLVMLVAVIFGFTNCQARSENKKVSEKTAGAAADEGGSIKLNKTMFLDKVWDYENSPKEWKFKGNKPVIIDFYADWCGPCRIASPILEELAKEYKDRIIVYKVDTQAEQELSAVFGIQGIPAFLYIPLKGKPTMTSGIARTKEDTKKMFNDNINKLLLTDN